MAKATFYHTRRQCRLAVTPGLHAGAAPECKKARLPDRQPGLRRNWCRYYLLART